MNSIKLKNLFSKLRPKKIEIFPKIKLGSISLQKFHKHISSNPNESVINKNKIKLEEDDVDLEDIEIVVKDPVEKREENKQTENLTKEISMDIFMNESKSYFEKIHKGFINLREYEDLKIETDKNLLFIRVTMPKIGTWIFLRELDTKTVNFTSPLSGFFKYKFDTNSKFWISLKDSHILDDLVIREFCKVSKGLLSFEQ